MSSRTSGRSSDSRNRKMAEKTGSSSLDSPTKSSPQSQISSVLHTPLVSIRIQQIPPPELRPNFRGSHFRIGRKKGQAKEATSAAWHDRYDFAALDTIKPGTKIIMNVKIVRPSRARELDDDNAWASIKYYRDTIAKHLGTDDRHFRQGDLEQVKMNAIEKEAYPDGYMDIDLVAEQILE